MELLYDKEFSVFWTLCGSDGNNAYLIVCPKTNESIIIDAPLGPEDILKQARDTQVKAILITHRHQDHLAGFGEITGSVDAPVGIGVEDVSALPRPPVPSQPRRCPPRWLPAACPRPSRRC